MKCIVDSGATSASWVFLDQGNERFEIRSKGMSPYYQSKEDIIQACRAVRPELHTRVKELHFYGSGCDGGENSLKVKEALQEVFTKASISVESDLLAAARALCQRKAGIACILGTGSNACIYDGTSVQEIKRGFGFILGDEGGGAALGKYFAIDYLYKKVPRELRQKAEAELAIRENDLMDKVYRQSFPSRYLASFVPFIHKHRKHPYFQEFLAQRIRTFFDLQVLPLYKQQALPIHIVGSVGHVFREELRKESQKLNLPLGQTTKDPMEGLVQFHA